MLIKDLKKEQGQGAAVKPSPVKAAAPKSHVPVLMGWRLKLCAWMIRFVGKYAPEILIGYVMERASEVAVGVTMAILDQERIAHCYKCPSRFSLRKVGLNRYACLTHTQETHNG